LTLGFVADELEEARRILERRQTARAAVRPAGLGETAARRNRSCGTDDAAESKRPEPARATVVVHATILR
jgi:hypothetical protein